MEFSPGDCYKWKKLFVGVTWLLEEHEHVVLCLHQGSIAHGVILLQENLDVQLGKIQRKRQGKQ